MDKQKAKDKKLKLRTKLLAGIVGLLTAYCLLSPAYSWLATAYSLLPPASRLLPPDSWHEAEAGYRYEFPRDHASHEDYAIEWWYYTGNLQAKDGRRFGYQLTFFRVGVARQPVNPSRWAVRNLYMTHLAISDIEQKQFHAFDRINRAGIGWAGAATDEYHQTFVHGRHGSPWDWAIDAAGVGLAGLLVWRRAYSQPRSVA